MSSSAAAVPNRPSPITSTECLTSIPPCCVSSSDAERFDCRPVCDWPCTGSQGEYKAQRAESADEHRRRKDEQCCVRQIGRDASGCPDRADRGDRLEDHLDERYVGRRDFEPECDEEHDRDRQE